jgi:O-antigen/teichoic acid export membrane protein
MAFSLLGGAVAGLGGLVLSVVIARGLGVAQAGVFFVSVGVFTIVSNTVELGADTGLVWATPRLRANSRSSDVGRTLVIAAVPVLVAGIASALLVTAFAHPLARIFMQQGDRVVGAAFLQSIAPYLAVAPLATVLLAASRGFGAFLPLVGIQNIAVPLARPLAIGVLVAVGAATAHSVAAAWGLPWLAAAVAAAVVVRVQSRRLNATEVPAVGAQRTGWRPLAAEFWTFAAARAFAGIAEISLIWLDVLLVGWLVGPVEAGIYAMASRFITTGSLALQASRIAIAPQLSRYISTKQIPAAERLLHAGTRLVIILSCPFYLGLAIFAPVVLRIFGHNYMSGTVPLTILALASLVDMATGNVQTALLMAGASRWNLINSATALVIDVLIDIVLIPHHGATGAAIGWAAAIVTINLMACAELQWSLRIRPTDHPTTKVAVATTVLFGACGLIVMAAVGRDLLGLAIWLAVGLPVFGAWLRRHPDLTGIGVLRQAVSARVSEPAASS